MRRSWLFLLLVPGLALGSQIVKRTLAERARLADRVVLAQVLTSRVVADKGNPRALMTLTEVVVGESLKGQGPERLTVLQRGGALGLWEVHIPGDARLITGETALLFLKCPEPGVCVLTALGEAKIGVQGGDAVLFDMATQSISKRPLSQVMSEVRAAVAPALAPKAVAK